jgi:hypothetical protein
MLPRVEPFGETIEIDRPVAVNVIDAPPFQVESMWPVEADALAYEAQPDP